MSKKNGCEVEVFNIGEFTVSLLHVKPLRLEAKIIFSRDHISQKLIFTLMEITHNYGLGCSQPYFQGPDDSNMVLLVGCVVDNKRSMKKHFNRLHDCLSEIKDFSYNFSQQLDFTKLDISMFNDVDFSDMYPEHFVVLKDQYYSGSWEEMEKALALEGRNGEVEIIKCCVEFEKVNSKDIGLVGHKLGYMLQMLEQVPPAENDAN